jgi:glycosyltransferase involved in cell wall biosynthesis
LAAFDPDPSRLKVAFVYAGGRLGRDAQGPSDFFYGARELARRPGWDVRLVESDRHPADPLTGLLAGCLLRRLVPPRTTADWLARSRRLLPELRGCDAVVATTTELSFGLALWKSWGFLQLPLVGILCGAVNYPIGSGLRRGLTAKLLSGLHPVLFAEAEKAELLHRFGPRKISVGWFGVDEEFWTPPSAPASRRGVLAVGNDGRRDYNTLVKAARSLPDESFRIISRLEPPAELPANVEWRRGDWREQAVSDEDLRELYRAAACVVVPLSESPQPSGQSVAMQAMMCGAPVVHTKTAGWWGADVIRDGHEVRLVPPADSTALAAAIGTILRSPLPGNSTKALLEARWTAAGFADRVASLVTQCLASDRTA